MSPGAGAGLCSLSLENLHHLDARVSVPGYSRASLSPGIVHFGPGNFHRVHQAVYLDALMNKGMDLDWALVGVSVMPGDEFLRQKLLEQDLLTTVVTQSTTGQEARITGPMVQYHRAADSLAILNALIDPRIRIVSLTVTEGGYFLNSETGRFNDQDSAIRRELAKRARPKTVFGLIVRALALRRQSNIGPFTVMSCDNLPHNGDVTRDTVLGLARLLDAELADWIALKVTFPNAMVDRIAPATGERELRLVREQYGIADNAPVYCEDYLQWVLEDKFVAGRPAFEKAGVQFVDDVTPYETMKVRILNGGHAIMAYAAGLMDIEFSSDAMREPLISRFLNRVEREEVLPVVPPVPGTDLMAYLELVEQRFANPSISDTVRRLCFDGSNRQPKFVVPSIRDQLATGGPVEGLALVSALWCRYCFGVTEGGAPIMANDPSWASLQMISAASKSRALAWLEMRNIYGDLAEHAAFSDRFAEALDSIWRDGTRATLSRYLAY